MTNNAVLAETIRHWERMINWVKTQNPEEASDKEVMEKAIGENWSGIYCSLCIEVRKSGNCKKCVLYRAQDEIVCGVEGTFWREINASITWGEWLFYAEQLLNLLRSLEGKES